MRCYDIHDKVTEISGTGLRVDAHARFTPVSPIHYNGKQLLGGARKIISCKAESHYVGLSPQEKINSIGD